MDKLKAIFFANYGQTHHKEALTNYFLSHFRLKNSQLGLQELYHNEGTSDNLKRKIANHFFEHGKPDERMHVLFHHYGPPDIKKEVEHRLNLGPYQMPYTPQFSKDLEQATKGIKKVHGYDIKWHIITGNRHLGNNLLRVYNPFTAHGEDQHGNSWQYHDNGIFVIKRTSPTKKIINTL